MVLRLGVRGVPEGAVVEMIAAGDQHAFAARLAEMEPPLRASLRASLRRFAAVADVEAVVQETFLRVWYGRGGIELHPKGRTLERLAFTIGRRLAIDEARRAGREREVAAWVETELPTLERDTSPDPHIDDGPRGPRADPPGARIADVRGAATRAEVQGQKPPVSSMGKVQTRLKTPLEPDFPERGDLEGL